MLEKVTYENHLGEMITFGENGYFMNYNELRDFTWEVTSRNDKISKFSKGIVEKTVPIIIFCENEASGIEKKNGLFEITEKDVLTKSYGKMIVGDYYLKCYVTGSKKSQYLLHKGYLELELTITTDCNSWVSEERQRFIFGDSDTTDSTDLDFPYDFSHDYATFYVSNSLENDFIINSNFKMIFYGPVENPSIVIADHEYCVYVTLQDGEYLVIDSIDKTITKVLSTGEEENCFSFRNKDSYVFQKIPTGNSTIVSEKTFTADIILLDERSEPRWT